MYDLSFCIKKSIYFFVLFTTPEDNFLTFETCFKLSKAIYVSASTPEDEHESINDNTFKLVFAKRLKKNTLLNAMKLTKCLTYIDNSTFLANSSKIKILSV